MEDLLKVSNIQRVCFHDGPGIRTTVFLSGCPIRCPWCSNPETSIYTKDDVYKFYTISELLDIIVKDKFLYNEEGGVTFSGGEPLIQSKNLSILMKKLKEECINIAIETSLYSNEDNLSDLIDHIDLFIIDIKILLKNEAFEIFGGKLEKYLNNIKKVFEKNKKVIFRIPLIYPYITNEENLNEIYDFLKRYKPFKVEIFKGHNLGKEKYKKLGLEYKDVNTINNDQIEEIKNKIREIGIQIEVINF